MDTIRDGFLRKVSDNGLVHRLAIYNSDGEITRVVGTGIVKINVKLNRRVVTRMSSMSFDVDVSGEHVSPAPGWW